MQAFPFRLYEELKEQYEKEKGKLKLTVSSLNDQIRDLDSKVTVINSEKQELESKLKSLEKHVKLVSIYTQSTIGAIRIVNLIH